MIPKWFTCALKSALGVNLARESRLNHAERKFTAPTRKSPVDVKRNLEHVTISGKTLHNRGDCTGEFVSFQVAPNNALTVPNLISHSIYAYTATSPHGCAKPSVRCRFLCVRLSIWLTFFNFWRVTGEIEILHQYAVQIRKPLMVYTHCLFLYYSKLEIRLS